MFASKTKNKEPLLSSYGTNNDEERDSESVPATPVWGRDWSHLLFSCNYTKLYLNYLFIFYFGLMFVDSFTHGVAEGWIFLFNAVTFLIQVSCVCTMVFGRMLSSLCVEGAVAEVMLWPFGALSTHSTHLSNSGHVALAAGEVLSLLPLLFLWWYLWKLAPECEYDFLAYDDDWDNCFGYNVSSYGFMCTVFLGFFAVCVPVYPLHGSQALVNILYNCGMGIENMAQVVIFVSMVYFVCFMSFAVVYHNWLSALVSLFILWQTWSLYQFYRYHGLTIYALFEDIDKLNKSLKEKTIRTVLESEQFQKKSRKAKKLLHKPYKAKKAFDAYKTGAYDDTIEHGQQAFEAWLTDGKSVKKKEDDSSSEGTEPERNPLVVRETLKAHQAEEFDEKEYEGAEGVGAYDDI